MRRTERAIFGTLLLLSVALAPLSAAASSITFSFSDGSRAASAKFERSGSNLVLTLTNTSAADALAPTDMLTALLFEMDGDPLLTPVSAVLPAGSSVLIGGTGVDVTPADRIVGGEWAYADELPHPAPFNAGVSASGLGLFGPHDVFPGPNLQGPVNVGGLEFAVAPAGDNLLTGNGGLAGRAFIRNSVVFTLSGFDGEPDAVIQRVAFQYGTSLSEPRFTAHTPEPTSWALMLLAAAGLAGVRLWHVRRGR